MQPNIHLGARHYHITLRVENNKSRRRPTSRSLSKILVSGLYLKLFSRGNTFLLAPSGTTGLIFGKPREKVELLSLSFLPLFSFSSFFPSYRIVWSKVKFVEYFLATCQYPIGSFDYPYHLIYLPWISLQSCVATCLLPTWALCLTYLVLDT